MRLYRTARDERHAWLPEGFWTPMREYAQEMHPGWPVYCTVLHPKATRKRASSARGANKEDIRRHRGKIDVLIFRSWDAPTTEYVVFRPKKVLRYC